MPSDLGAPELTESHRKSAYTLLHVDRFVPFSEAQEVVFSVSFGENWHAQINFQSRLATRTQKLANSIGQGQCDPRLLHVVQ
jgi:hypothetical protein